MNQQVFITSRERLNPRWQEAFEDAFCRTHANFSAQQLTAETAVHWLDISQLPTEERIPLLRQIVSQTEKLMVMTDEQTDQEAMRVMQAGAVGYCHYLSAPEQLREIANVVSQGGLWLGVQLMQKLLVVAAASYVATEDESVAETDQYLEQLTPRERTVAVEVGKGATNKEIAKRLDITERTVKAHISAIFDKLEVRDRVKLALFINELSKKPPLVVL